MPIMEVKIIPIGTPTASVSEHIARAVQVLKEESTKHQLTAMGTIMESDSREELLALAGRMHEAALTKADRILTFIELDERKDKESSMEEKVRSAQKKL